MAALCFIKKYIIQKGYVNYGIGSNGKSTFLTILRNMIGINNTTSIPMQLFQKNQFIGYELRGKCANISADGGTEPITKTGYIKSVLGKFFWFERCGKGVKVGNKKEALTRIFFL